MILPKLKKDYKKRLWTITYADKLDSLDKMDKFLKIHKLSKLTQEEIENLNRFISSKKTELVIKNFPKKKGPGPDSFLANSIKHSKN